MDEPTAIRPLGLTDHEINWSFGLSDERLASLPLVSTHGEPQIAPQEYECGCVTITRITDRDHRRGERPFEMRLARACETDACELTGSIFASDQDVARMAPGGTR